MFNSRRMLPGSRPDSSAASSGCRDPSPSTPTHDRDGSQPSPFRPGQPQHLRTACADPNRDRMRCRRPALRALDPGNVGDAAYQPAAERA